MQTKLIVAAVSLAAVFILGAAFFTSDATPDRRPVSPEIRAPQIEQSGTATIDGDVQYIDITARAGYSPRVVRATAGMPAVLRVHTDNTYDCSIALVIPDLKFQKYLSPTGVETIEIPADKAQGTLRGMCSMAMYQFQIVFE